eukprot:765063-Hanusia_phi.AAC.5
MFRAVAPTLTAIKGFSKCFLLAAGQSQMRGRGSQRQELCSLTWREDIRGLHSAFRSRSQWFLPMVVSIGCTSRVRRLLLILSLIPSRYLGSENPARKERRCKRITGKPNSNPPFKSSSRTPATGAATKHEVSKTPMSGVTSLILETMEGRY